LSLTGLEILLFVATFPEDLAWFLILELLELLLDDELFDDAIVCEGDVEFEIFEELLDIPALEEVWFEGAEQ